MKREWTDSEFADWTLLPSEAALLVNKTGPTHRAQIRAFLGFREPTVQDANELAAWLSEHILPQGHPDEHVNAAAYQRLRDLGIEPPTPDRLERIFASASSAFEEGFCTETVGQLPSATLGQLEALLSAGDRRWRNNGNGILAPPATENGFGAGGPR